MRFLPEHQKKKQNWWVRILVSMLGALGIVVMLLAWIAIQERAIYERAHWPEEPEAIANQRGSSGTSNTQSTQASPSQPLDSKASPANQAPSHPSSLSTRSWEPLVSWLLLLLVGLQLSIPMLWVYVFHKFWCQDSNVTEEDYLAWVTAIGVPYFILGFAMLVEYHAFIEDRRVGVGAIAAIMILYALSVLSSFLYLEVRDLKKSFDKKLASASTWFGLQLTLADADAGQPSPAESITALLRSWSTIYNLDRDKEPTRHVRLRRNALGTLLSTYMKEEAIDARGALSVDQVPATVWPWRPEDLDPGSPPKGISFIASNTTYYAKFLQEVAQFLPSATRDHSGVFLATITYAPPPFWWNWDGPEKKSYIYSPIDEYRKTLAEIAQSHGSTLRRAQIFRKIILTDGKWKSDRLLSATDWDVMKDWLFLVPKDSKDKYEPIRSDQKGIHTDFVKFLIPGIAWTEGKTTAGQKTHVYWTVTSGAQEIFYNSVCDFNLVPVNEVFSRQMHPNHQGATTVHKLPEAVFTSPLIGSLEPGLNGCGEMLFLGLEKKNSPRNVWEDKNPDLALAILSTMSPNSETMFMTIVWGEDRLNQLWDGVKRASQKFPASIVTL